MLFPPYGEGAILILSPRVHSELIDGGGHNVVLLPRATEVSAEFISLSAHTQAHGAYDFGAEFETTHTNTQTGPDCDALSNQHVELWLTSANFAHTEKIYIQFGMHNAHTHAHRALFPFVRKFVLSLSRSEKLVFLLTKNHTDLMSRQMYGWDTFFFFVRSFGKKFSVISSQRGFSPI